MDGNKRLYNEYESRYSWLLVFLFLCGSMLSLIYMPRRIIDSGFSIQAYALALAILLLLLALLSTSVCGRFLTPLCFILFGVITAFNSAAACEELYGFKDLFLRRIAVSALFTPLCFTMGVGGMSNSGAICAALAAEGSIWKKRYKAMYTVMTAAAAVSTLLVVYVVLK